MDFTDSQEDKELKQEKSVHILSIVLVYYCCYKKLTNLVASNNIDLFFYSPGGQKSERCSKSSVKM